MNLRSVLTRLVKVVSAEADRNPAFAAEINEALGLAVSGATKKAKKDQKTFESDSGELKRPKNRRSPALVEPVKMVKEGEHILRAELQKLDLEQLRDVVAENGMDTGRLVMKWINRERVIERIVEMALSRSQKGDAFRRTEATALDNTKIES